MGLAMSGNQPCLQFESLGSERLPVDAMNPNLARYWTDQGIKTEHQRKSMDRKKFLLTTGLTAIAMSAFGRVVQHLDGDQEMFGGDCATTNDILGPFYRPGSPVRADLTHEGLQGARITVQGRVLGPDCKKPLQNATVEIWHCDTLGEYDNESNEFRLRGQWKTDASGAYSFKTIFPGKYLNGRLYRPAHIHFRVSAPGHKELISQIYFKGDPHILEDPWASQSKANQRILPVLPEGILGDFTVHFDVFLNEG
jgi:catechol 1,2-dioxygenase